MVSASAGHVVILAMLVYISEGSVSVESIVGKVVLGSWAAPYFMLGNESFDVTASTLYVVGSSEAPESIRLPSAPTFNLLLSIVQ